MDPEGSGDVALVRLAKVGDRQALACLLNRYQPLVRRICQRTLSITDGLEDVAQETALQAMLSLDDLRDASQFGSWLVGIGLNVARRSRRYRARAAWSWDALVGGRHVDEPSDDAPQPDESAEVAELSRRVRCAVSNLPPGQRSAVLLVYLSGLTYRETAVVLGIGVGALKTRLHKGRHNLQQHLRDLWMEDVMTTPISVEPQAVEMRVADVRRRPGEGDAPPRSVLVLKEVGGERQLPIWTGNWEGDMIALSLEKVQVPRPLTHAFTASLLRAGGVRVKEVRISRLADETYFAQVVLGSSAGEQTVDARPSDAIGLALRVDAPIFVAAAVLTAAEAARAERGAGGARPAAVGIGAAEIVTNLLEHWPSGQKPIRPT